MRCKKCGKLIGREIEVNSIIKKVSRTRRHCFDCIAFCYQNERRLEIKGNEKLLICKSCNKPFCSIKGNLVCGSCRANNRRFKFKKSCLEYKGSKCKICGYNKCVEALAFHHRNPEDKLFGISGSHCRKWPDVQKELDKCDLLCHNCHVETHCQDEKICILEDYSI